MKTFALSSLFSLLLVTVGYAQDISEKTTQQPIEKIHENIESKSLISRLQEGGVWWYMLGLAFLSGILVSFTPCVYPMIPITVGILQAQASQSLFYNFLSATSYVMGIATIYAGLGYLSATTTLIFGRWLASPWFIFFMILFFLYLAFSMFGFYEMYTPRFLAGGAGTSTKKSLLNSFLFGLISGSAASPCLTPALALLLGIVAKTGNPLFGFAMLFVFALGMGTLLILVGTFSSTINLLPRAGMWMDEIKKVFGFMMLAVCVYFLQPLVTQRLTMQLYAVVLLIAAGYYFMGQNRNRVKIAVGVALVLGAIVLILQSLKVMG